MNNVWKWRWLVLAAWVLAVAALLMTMPDMGNLVREKGQINIPEGYMSRNAQELLNKLSGKSGQEMDMSLVAVFHGDAALTDQQMQEIGTTVQALEQKKSELGIQSILSPIGRDELKDQLISKDKTTVLVSINAAPGSRTKEQVRADFTKFLKDNSKLPAYLTGAPLIVEDFVETTQAGVHRTEGIAVLFIVVVLIIIFRSPVAPVISLLSVGISYLVANGIVAQLVDRFNYPFSNFTQIFLVLVLFGIGTDYNILLFSRFKEELLVRESKLEAVIHTYKTAGKTVLVSGLAVFIGFSVLGLAKFQLFKSASAVGIGVGVLLLALVTVMPVLMGLLGGRLFWPSKVVTSHEGSKIVNSITGFAVRRPYAGIALSLALSLSVLFFYRGDLSYNSLKEIDESLPAVQGITVVNEHFPAGQALPSTLVLENGEAMDSAAALGFIDKVSEAIAKIPGVDAIYSATRPMGKKIPELYSSDQQASLKKGVDQANAGLVKIRDGLKGAAAQLQAAPSGGADQVGQLVAGTQAAQAGVDQAAAALSKISTGLVQGADGTRQLRTAIDTLTGSLSQLSQSTEQLTAGLGAIQTGYGTLLGEYQKLEGVVTGMLQASEAMAGQIARLEKSEASLAANSDFAALKQTAAGLNAQLKQLSGGIAALNGQFSGANGQLAQISQGLAQVQAGQGKLLAGAQQISASAGALETGLAQAAAGQSQVTAKLPELSGGLAKINQGQQQLGQGLAQISGQIGQLTTGLNDSVTGLDAVSAGLVSIGGYLEQASGSPAAETFFIPEAVRTGAEFAQSLDQYMSADRRLTKWQIILSVDPYSAEAMDVIDNIRQTFTELAKGTPYQGADFGINGVPAQNSDLNAISSGDFSTTVSLMLAGIFIVLIAVTRSFWTPVFIIASMVAAYYSALSLTELIFRNFTGSGELNWTIPFFAFIMIVALGVDYSIFLMMRYREYKHLPPRQAIVEAVKYTGGVIVSAVIILSGTFAAMYPSGVLTLTQMATGTIIALFLLAFLFLPLFIPACMALKERLTKGSAPHSGAD